MGNDGHLLLITEGHQKQGNTSYYTISFSPQLALLRRLIERGKQEGGKFIHVNKYDEKMVKDKIHYSFQCSYT
jgi:hypothetical protein